MTTPTREQVAQVLDNILDVYYEQGDRYNLFEGAQQIQDLYDNPQGA